MDPLRQFSDYLLDMKSDFRAVARYARAQGCNKSGFTGMSYRDVHDLELKAPEVGTDSLRSQVGDLASSSRCSTSSTGMSGARA